MMEWLWPKCGDYLGHLAHVRNDPKWYERLQFSQVIRMIFTYCQTSNISHTLIGIKIVDHSDVVGAQPVGAAPTIS